MTSTLLVIAYVILNILASISSQFSLFINTMPFMEDQNYLSKLLSSEFWASLQWAIALPAFRIGSQFLTPIQLFFMGYLFGFIVQVFSDIYIFKLAPSWDSYFCIIMILFAMYVSKMKLFG